VMMAMIVIGLKVRRGSGDVGHCYRP